MDLSLGGCRIKTQRTVLTGVHLVLRLDFPGEEEPIRIERGSTGEECGVYFVTVGVRHHERLKQIVRALEKQAE